MPEFQHPPERYVYHHIVDGPAAGTNGTPADNLLLIGDRASGNLKFWFELEGYNFHICSMSGTARSVSHHAYLYHSGECTLRISFPSKTTAVIDDIGRACEPESCAMNASINNTKFVLSAK